MTDTHVHAAPPPSGPEGELSIRTLAMPADTNQNGDIFGGWLLSQMDLAGSVYAYKTTRKRFVTVGIEAMTFRKPVFVGDLVSVYATTVRIGRTSITVHLESWVQRRGVDQVILVTDGNYTYVAIDENGHPEQIQPGSTPPATV
jgi:acyl-CoA thioesterase YciA